MSHTSEANLPTIDCASSGLFSVPLDRCIRLARRFSDTQALVGHQLDSLGSMFMREQINCHAIFRVADSLTR
jgi:hypothetical protein